MKTENRYLQYTILFALLHAVFFVCMLSIFRPIPSADVVENFFWGRHFELGYYKHPPFFAWVSAVYAILFGTSVFTSYLIAQSFIFITFIAVFFLAKEFLPAKKAFIAVLLLEALSFAGIAGRTFNANLAQIPFWVLAPLFYIYGIKSKKLIHFGLFGFFLGLSFLSKYFTLLLAFTIFVSFVSNKKTRELLKTPLPYFAVFIFFIVVSPNIYWVFNHDFLPMQYIASEQPKTGFWAVKLRYTIPFIFLSIITALPVVAGVFYLFKIKTFNGINMQNPLDNLLFCLSVIPFAVLSFFAIITQMFILVKWSATFFFTLPIFILYFWQVTEKPAFNKKLKLFLAFFFFLWGIIIIVSGIRDAINKKQFSEDIKSLALFHLENFKKETGKELTLVAGNTLEAGFFSFYSKKNLAVLPENNISFAPYITPDKLKEGYIFIMSCNKEICDGEKFGKVKEIRKTEWKKKPVTLYVIYVNV